jgi:hypothetical protein
MTRKTAWITTVDAKDAERELAELYDQVRDPQTGLLDHIMTIHSLHPKGLDAHFRLYAASMTGTSSTSPRSRPTTRSSTESPPDLAWR